MQKQPAQSCTLLISIETSAGRKLIESAMKHHKDGTHEEFAVCISPGCVAYASIVLLQEDVRIHCDTGRLLATAIGTQAEI
jgi:hypothetical protein